MTAVVLKMNDAAAPLNVVLPCRAEKGKEPGGQPTEDNDLTARSQAAAVQRSMAKVFVPFRSASAAPLTRTAKDNHATTRPERPREICALRVIQLGLCVI